MFSSTGDREMKYLVLLQFILILALGFTAVENSWHAIAWRRHYNAAREALEAQYRTRGGAVNPAYKCRLISSEF